jgi:hypothetical protein
MVSPVAGTTVSAGLAYVGSWANYDALAQYRCFGGTGPCQATSRDYIVAYPGFVKINATMTSQITPVLTGYVSVNNLANRNIYEAGNDLPVKGRLTTVGLEFNY